MRMMIAFTLILMMGCGGGESLPKPVQVTGKIQFKGKPAAGAVIGYSALSSGIPARLRYQEGVSDDSGNYQLKEVSPGEYMVCIVLDQTKSEKVDGEGDAAASGLGSPPFSRMSDENPLRANVSAEATNFDFDLKP